MNNAEWIKLLRKQRERDEAARTEVEEDNKHESFINNGDGDNKGSDAGNATGGEGDNSTEFADVGNDSGTGETGESDNGDA